MALLDYRQYTERDITIIACVRHHGVACKQASATSPTEPCLLLPSTRPHNPDPAVKRMGPRPTAP